MGHELVEVWGYGAHVDNHEGSLMDTGLGSPRAQVMIAMKAPNTGPNPRTHIWLIIFKHLAVWLPERF